MAVWALGLNHNTAPLDIRGRLAFAPEQMGASLNALRDQIPGAAEATILSTCNRTEIYCHAEEPRAAVEWMASYHQLKPAQIEPYLYKLPRERDVGICRGREVVGLTVTVGIDRPARIPSHPAQANKIWRG